MEAELALAKAELDNALGFKVQYVGSRLESEGDYDVGGLEEKRDALLFDWAAPISVFNLAQLDELARQHAERTTEYSFTARMPPDGPETEYEISYRSSSTWLNVTYLKGLLAGSFAEDYSICEDSSMGKSKAKLAEIDARLDQIEQEINELEELGDTAHSSKDRRLLELLTSVKESLKKERASLAGEDEDNVGFGVGWKVHISIDDTDKESYCRAWEAVLYCTVKYGLPEFKVKGMYDEKGNPEFFGVSQTDHQIGKVFCVYLGPPIIVEKHRGTILEALFSIHLMLLTLGVRAGPRLVADRPLTVQSPYLYYRNDSDRHGFYVDAEGSHSYNPRGAIDCIGEFATSFFANKLGPPSVMPEFEYRHKATEVTAEL